MPRRGHILRWLCKVIFQQSKVGDLIAIIFHILIIDRLKKDTEKAELEAAGKTDEEKLIGIDRGEGDLFGVRALEHGYFGGVSQSRCNSPTASTFGISPRTSVLDLNKAGLAATNATTNGATPNSVTLLPQKPTLSADSNNNERKPSPLTFDQPSNVEGIASPFDDLQKISSSDEHDNALPTHNPRPTSYLPRFRFQGKAEMTEFIILTPSEYFRDIKSETASFASGETSPIAHPPPVARLPSLKSQTPSAFPPSDPQVPARLTRGVPRSIFPAIDAHERPISSHKSRMTSKFEAQPVRLSDMAPHMVTIDSDDFPFPRDTRNWNTSPPTRNKTMSPVSPSSAGPVFRDSVESKKSISIHEPSHSPKGSDDGQTFLVRTQSIGASSIYCTRTSILDFETPISHHSRNRSRTDFQPCLNKHSHSTSKTKHKGSGSSRSISRTRDSLRGHNRKLSRTRDSKRPTRGRDMAQYNPATTSSIRAGSLQARITDFDQPRE